MRIGPKGSHRDSHRCSIYVCMHVGNSTPLPKSFLFPSVPEPDHPFVPTNRTFHELICSFGRARSFHADDVSPKNATLYRGEVKHASRFTGPFLSLFRFRIERRSTLSYTRGILAHGCVCTQSSVFGSIRFGLSWLEFERVEFTVASEY